MNDSSKPVHPDPPEEEKKYLFDNPANVKRVLKSLYILCALLFLLDLPFLFHRHSAFHDHDLPIEEWMGFYSVYGCLSCVVLVLLAREMRKVVMRKEDYYDE